jgi:hypothetical protein
MIGTMQYVHIQSIYIPYIPCQGSAWYDRMHMEYIPSMYAYPAGHVPYSISMECGMHVYSVVAMIGIP